jgi:predicted permease
LSIVIAALGFLVAAPFVRLVGKAKERRQFLSLVVFQNSGYLPLALVAALLSGEEAAVMFIYIFLYLVGFNLLIWSVVPYFLTYHKESRFEFAKLFSPPVLATLFGLVLVYLGVQRFIPQFIFRPLKMIGDCTLPLALFVVGASLAEVKFKQGVNKKAIFWVILAKLMIMPAIILLFLSKVKIPYLLGLFLLIQAAMPSATSLSIIIRQSKEEDYLINSSIFIGHIISIFSIPLFLTLYYFMIQ